MMTRMTQVFGIPVPSTDPIFIGIIMVHIPLGILCVVCGFCAMLIRKGRGGHSRWGNRYYWALAGVSGTMVALSLMRWQENWPLFVLGIVSFGAAWVARSHDNPRSHVRRHATGMAVSYITMLTAFYVDNGKSLPFWRYLPHWSMWVLPALIGLPFLGWVLQRHPLTRKGR